jgi:hypothetical protein
VQRIISIFFACGWGRKEVAITLVRREVDRAGVCVVVEPSEDAR